LLKPAIDFGKQALSLMKDVQQNKSDIKELREEPSPMLDEIDTAARRIGLVKPHRSSAGNVRVTA